MDLENIDKQLNKNKSKIPYRGNEHNFVRVAFDVFKFTGSPVESYWTLEKDEDGSEYLVANYEKSPDTLELKAQSNWEALSDKKAENVTLLYSGVPIRRFASSDYSFDASDVHIFKQAMIEKLSGDPKFVENLLKVVPEEKRKALIQTFPELATQKE